MANGPRRRTVLVGGLLAAAGVLAAGAAAGRAAFGRRGGGGTGDGPVAGADDDGLLGPLRGIVSSDRTPLLQTTFDDDTGWRTVADALTGRSGGAGWDTQEESLVDAVVDRRYEDLDVSRLADAWPKDLLGYVIVTDARTMAEARAGASIGTVSVLYVDLSGERGRTFRTAVDQVPDVAMNLFIANMDFFEFADAAGPDGVFRGFPTDPDE